MSSSSPVVQLSSKDWGTIYVGATVIGKGSYGSVVTGEDNQHKQYALKMIPNVKSADDNTTITAVHSPKKKRCTGVAIRLLLEPIIMMSIRHPHLMAAEQVVTNTTTMTIMMKLAMGSLLCRDVMEFSRLQRLSNQLISAIATLHHHQIIHGDIKPANILLLSDDHIALTDFGLSIVKEHSAEDFSHRIGTHTYRAPESLQGSRWDEKFDSWALGCTLYEMAYGIILFPSQKEWDLSLDLDQDTIKNNGNQRCLNAIVDWCNLNASTYDKFCKISTNQLPYHPVKLHYKWNDSTMMIFNDLIVKLLHPEPSQRLSVTDALAHPWVTAITHPITYGTLHLTAVKPLPDIARLTNLLKGYFVLSAKIKPSFFHKTAELYSKVNLDSHDQVLVMLGCGWIIGKLYYHRILQAKAGEHLIELPDIELAILTNIGYCMDL